MPYDGGVINHVPEGSWWFAGVNGNFTPEYVEKGGLGKRNGGGAPQTFGKTQAYTDLMAAVQNGGEFSLTTKNGYMSWWTGGAAGDANTAQEMIAHMMKLGDNASTDWYGLAGKTGFWYRRSFEWYCRSY
ncbi:hypothetical protein [Chryseobacterium sp. Marseille-Q8038]